MSKIKSFRGKLVDGGQDTIHLRTNTGTTGYTIKKFQIMITQIGAVDEEHVVKIYSIEQSSVPTSAGTVDFSDNTLLAAAQSSASSDARFYPEDYNVVFDNITINQDIYITHTDNQSSADVNYYIELEQRSLDLNESTVATLKDIRNND
tara:strand:- start:5 stop:451 length:447 start_codon:yes stop_codon:yes gene_type:complete